MNTGVSGQVVDSAGAGIGCLIVEVYAIDFIDTLLGSATTQTTGSFVVSYPAVAFGVVAPDLKARVYDPIKRLLHETAVTLDVTAAVLPLPTITLNRADIDGWLVTLGTGAPVALTTDNDVEALVDNETAWSQLILAVQGATKSIELTQLYFDVQTIDPVKGILLYPGVFYQFTQPVVSGSPASGDRLEEELVTATSRGVTVRVLLNDFYGAIYPVDTAGHAQDYFAFIGTISGVPVYLRTFSRMIYEPMHAKFAVFDGAEAHFIGSPFQQEYFDTTSHLIDDPRHGVMTVKNAERKPIHDVGFRLRGPAVQAVIDTFYMLWNEVGAPASAGAGAGGAAGSDAVQIVRTLPGNAVASIPQGELGILEGYQRAIRNASDFIYLENQYFTEDAIGDALVAALSANAKLQVVMLINSAVDLPKATTWQNALLYRFLLTLAGIKALDRVGIFTLWSQEATPAGCVLMRNYVHSKVAVVDDAWATVGSANLDGPSLRQSQYAYYMPNSERIRAVEVNAIVYNGVDGQPPSDFPDELRRTLWMEHLGYTSASDPALTTRPAGGWLSLWNDRKDLKHAAIAAGKVHPSRILEWLPEKDPAAYLRGVLGLKLPAGVTTQVEERYFDLVKGNWL